MLHCLAYLFIKYFKYNFIMLSSTNKSVLQLNLTHFNFFFSPFTPKLESKTKYKQVI